MTVWHAIGLRRARFAEASPRLRWILPDRPLSMVGIRCRAREADLRKMVRPPSDDLRLGQSLRRSTLRRRAASVGAFCPVANLGAAVRAESKGSSIGPRNGRREHRALDPTFAHVRARRELSRRLRVYLSSGSRRSRRVSELFRVMPVNDGYRSAARTWMIALAGKEAQRRLGRTRSDNSLHRSRRDRRFSIAGQSRCQEGTNQPSAGVMS